MSCSRVLEYASLSLTVPSTSTAGSTMTVNPLSCTQEGVSMGAHTQSGMCPHWSVVGLNNKHLLGLVYSVNLRVE